MNKLYENYLFIYLHLKLTTDSSWENKIAIFILQASELNASSVKAEA